VRNRELQDLEHARKMKVERQNVGQKTNAPLSFIHSVHIIVIARISVMKAMTVMLLSVLLSISLVLGLVIFVAFMDFVSDES